MRADKRHAFTLIELLVVIAIIAILAAMLLPVLGRARAMARNATCQNRVKQLFVAGSLYADNNGDFFPIWNPQAPWFPPTNSWGYEAFDVYLNYEYGVHYGQYGPLLPGCIYFCSEFVRANEGRAASHAWPWSSFGYAVNYHYYNSWFYYHNPWEVRHRRSRGRIPRPAFTLMMRELNPPYRVDYWIDGPDVWPANRITGTLSPYSSKYGRMHLDGQNVLYYDGHTERFVFPNPVECQLNDGYDWTNYSGWMWPS